MSNTKLYENMKAAVSMMHLASAILAVRRNPDGSIGSVIFHAVNKIFEDDALRMFNGNAAPEDMLVEGKPYTAFLPQEPKFEDICYRAAWQGEYIHTYVDTTNMYGFWTEDILMPMSVEDEEDPEVRFCQFSYTLNKEMDKGKFATVPPDIASFVIKTCLQLRNEDDFMSSMEVVTKDIREYTDAYATSIMTVTPDLFKFDVISEDVRDNEICIKDVFAEIPYEVVESWEALVYETNCIIIKDEKDLLYYESKSPAWVATLRHNDVHSLILVPFIHQNAVIGYLYITNFDTNQVIRLKETIELVSFFLSSEVANHMIMERLEYLSTIDMLTGVYNRNCMNVNVDELSTKLKLHPKPFSVAFCDLNGLKTINDNVGHNDGDRLLKDAASVLKEIFVGDQIYRAGGDEFTIISLHGTEQDFMQKIAMLKQEACDPDWLYFAVGYYHDASSGNLRLALRYADERMYKDKDAYYAAHPERRR